MQVLEKASMKLLRATRRRKKGTYQPRTDDKFFQEGFQSTQEYLNRFNNQIDFKNKTVLDLGCGYGSTCFRIAKKGALEVVGVDPFKKALFYAKNKLNSDAQFTQSKISFFESLEDLHNKQFDIILSKNSFEHYENPERYIEQILQYLKPDGQLVIGFSPFWKAPTGGHINPYFKLPWTHLLFPEKIVIQELNNYLNTTEFHSYGDVANGLNKITVKRFSNIIQNNKLNTVFIKTNQASAGREKQVLKIFTILSKFPFLKEYFTVNIYCILKKDKEGLRDINCVIV
ncbi:MAG: class I SAM-dependent methyltransferase [Candidatus Bathyarchaeota archaeon]|nr:class I SAM-dependent methyltransferase [Candidatus Bathyarchaeota archaeon]